MLGSVGQIRLVESSVATSEEIFAANRALGRALEHFEAGGDGLAMKMNLN
jgi:hypothetical protein